MIPSMAQQLADFARSAAASKNKGTQTQMDRAKELDRAILETIEDFGPNDAKSIAIKLRANVSTVSQHLHALAENGRVTFSNERPRKWSLK